MTKFLSTTTDVFSKSHLAIFTEFKDDPKTKTTSHFVTVDIAERHCWSTSSKKQSSTNCQSSYKKIVTDCRKKKLKLKAKTYACIDRCI